MSKIISGFKKAFLFFHEFSQKQWFVWSFIYTFAGVWFSLILAFWGEELGLLKTANDGTAQFTPLGIILTCVSILWTFFCMASDRYYDYHKNNSSIYDPNGGEHMLGIVCDEVSEICDKKLSHFLKDIDEIKKGNKKPCIVAGDPCAQISELSSKLAYCLSKLLSRPSHKIKNRDFSIRLFYNFPCENQEKWFCAQSNRSESSTPINELLASNTTLYQALHNERGNFIFWNKKEEAKIQGHYKTVDNDLYEDDGQTLKGSIACYRMILCSNNTEYVRSVLCVSTYNKSFVKSKTKEYITNAKDNMRRYVIEEFVKRYKIELASIYLQHLYMKDKDTQDDIQSDTASPVQMVVYTPQ